VNTFWTSDAQLVGDNTDVEGFDRAARRVLPDAATNITVGVLGAGGAAAGVLAAIEQWPSARVLIWNRTRDRAESLAARFGSVAKYSDVDEIACTADLVVNATTVGMREGDPVPIDVATLRRATTVMDLVYRRSGDDTPLVRAARGRGLAACDGLPMLLEQGALAFERWFGFAPDRAAMEQSISLAR
jgi:shikimate dehydrogenase